MREGAESAAVERAGAVVGAWLGHRSIRRYLDEPVRDEDVRRAVSAGQAAATSSAVQGYCVIRVRDAERRGRIAELCGPQAKVAEAPAFFVVCGDARRHRLVVERSGGSYEQRLEGFRLCVIDAALFAQNMVVALEAMGYGTCYIGGLRNDLHAVNRVLSVPEGVYPLFGLCVGRPAEEPMERPRLGVDAVLLEEVYPGDEAMLGMIDEYDGRYRAYLRERGAAEVVGWSEAMAGKLGGVRRPELGSFYTGRGARLD